MSRKKTLSATKGKGSKSDLSKGIDRFEEEFSDQDWLDCTTEGSLAWRSSLINSPKLASHLLNCNTPGELTTEVAKLLKLDDCNTNLVHSILVDSLTLVLLHAQEQDYNVLTTSAFFTLHYEMICNVRDRSFTLQQQIEHFTKIMLAHSTLEPWQEGEMLDFHGSAVHGITRYTGESLLLHHNLYTALFLQAAELEVTLFPVTVLSPPLAQPLGEATPLKTLLEARALRAAKEDADTVVPAGLTPAQANIILQHTIDSYLGKAQIEMGITVDQHLDQAQRIQEGSSPAHPP